MFRFDPASRSLLLLPKASVHFGFLESNLSELDKTQYSVSQAVWSYWC